MMVRVRGLAAYGGCALYAVRFGDRSEATVPASRSSLKTVHRTVFSTLGPSQGSSPLHHKQQKGPLSPQ